MATITKIIGGFGDDGMGNAVCRFEIDYDDNTLRVTGFRCVNNGTAAAYGTAQRISDGLIYGTRFPVGTTFINVPTGAAQRLQLTVTPSGKLDGVEYHFMYPYP